MIMLGMEGWKAELSGKPEDLERYNTTWLDRILDRIFGGKMIEVLTLGGKPMLIKRTEIKLAEFKDDPLPAPEDIRGQIKQLEGVLAEYQDKLKPESVEELKAKISELRAKLPPPPGRIPGRIPKKIRPS